MITIYVDGSYDKDNKIYGYGVVILSDDEILEELHGYGQDVDGAWNVSGEIQATIRAIQISTGYGFSEITICHDYEGIEAWATGRWKAKKNISKSYVDIIKSSKDSGLVIHFQKIKAHSGVFYNERADQLAALGVSEGIKNLQNNKF